MISGLSAVFGVAALLLSAMSSASQPDYLFQDRYLCDETGAFCMLGTLTFQPNPRLLHLRARVRKAPGPGLLRIILIGSNRLGYRRLAPFEVRVRGNVTEILNHKMVPDHPDALGWAVQYVEFITDDAS